MSGEKDKQGKKKSWLDKLKGLVDQPAPEESAPPPIEIPQVQITQSYDGGISATIALSGDGDETLPPDTAVLRRQMNQYLTLVDLEEIGAELGTPYAGLPTGKDSKVYGLIAACEREDTLADLVAACAKRYGAVSWGQAVAKQRDHEKRPFLDTVYLRQQMSNHLNEAQLATVSATVGVEYATLKGGKGRKVLTLIQACEQLRRLEDLLHACETAVPAVDWRGSFKSD